MRIAADNTLEVFTVGIGLCAGDDTEAVETAWTADGPPSIKSRQSAEQAFSPLLLAECELGEQRFGVVVQGVGQASGGLIVREINIARAAGRPPAPERAVECVLQHGKLILVVAELIEQPLHQSGSD